MEPLHPLEPGHLTQRLAQHGIVEKDQGVERLGLRGAERCRSLARWFRKDQKALRALDPSKGRNFKDRLRREKKRQRILQGMIKGNEIPTEATYPGLHERWGRPKEEQVALHVNASHLRRVVEKLVKGITFIESGRYLDGQTEIEHHVVEKEGAVPIEDVLAQFGKAHSREPGIEVVRAVAPDDGVSVLYKITIWGQFLMYASVLREPAQRGAPNDGLDSAVLRQGRV